MAQLIKLQDYISRYETDMYKYPGQYIRAKKKHWETMKQKWTEQRLGLEQPPPPSDKDEPPSKWKRLFKRQDKEETTQDPSPEPPTSLDDGKQIFLDNLFSVQLKWATSTLWEKSFLDPDYKHDKQLKYFLQRFPDTFLIMYEPLVKIKQAPMEINTILIGPIGIEIIHFMEASANSVIVTEDNRTWYIKDEHSSSKIISPLIALNRSETYVKSVLSKYGIDFPYSKVILAPENEFKSTNENFHTSYIGKVEYQKWFEEKRKLRSPLKHSQLKAAEALVKHSQTTAIRRPEWDQEDQGFVNGE
ncbi:NERD domain-containing protein [Halobacillus sp. MO56]